MRIERTGTMAALCAAAALWGGGAWGLSAADKCEASKLKASGKLSSCQLRADARAVKSGGTADFSKCDACFSAKWDRAETQGMGQCPTSGDEATIQAFITQCTDDVAALLSGGAPSSCVANLATCNTSLGACNGSLGTCSADLTTCNSDLATTQASLATCNGDLGTCNGTLGTCQTDLATCQAIPKGQRIKTGQTTCYDSAGMVIACAGTGQDGELQKGLAPAYVDNGSSTTSLVVSNNAWYLYFLYGQVEWAGKSGNNFGVRAVRGGS